MGHDAVEESDLGVWYGASAISSADAELASALPEAMRATGGRVQVGYDTDAEAWFLRPSPIRHDVVTTGGGRWWCVVELLRHDAVTLTVVRKRLARLERLPDGDVYRRRHAIATTVATGKPPMSWHVDADLVTLEDGVVWLGLLPRTARPAPMPVRS